MNTINELLNRCEELCDDIKKYIMSNKDWIYYFLNPSAKGNEELFNLVKIYPDVWEDIIDIKIKVVSENYVIVNLIADGDYFDDFNLERTIVLSAFETTVERNKMMCEGKLNRIRIDSLREEINALKDTIKEKEEKIKKLEEEYKTK